MNYTLATHLDYSVWATERLAETLRSIPAEKLDHPVKSSFPSISKTLLHMWNAEVVWLQRLQGVSLTDWPAKNFQGTSHELLDGLIQSARNLRAFIQRQDESFLSSTISYKNLKGEPYEDSVASLLFHVINHGTYHRGQITTLLRELDVDQILSMDIIIYLRTIKK